VDAVQGFKGKGEAFGKCDQEETEIELKMQNAELWKNCKAPYAALCNSFI